MSTSGASATNARARLALHLALLVVATWLAFAPALDAEFVNWDDGELLVNNPAFRGFSGEHLRWMFTTTHLGPYQPLSWLTYALDHATSGMDARVFHRTNLLLHCSGAVALYFLARRVLGDLFGARAGVAAGVARPAFVEFGALAAALLFAVHPLRVESVAWCTERRDVLSAPFFFLSLLFWWRHAQSASARDHALALAWLVLSLLAKASAIVMPALLLLLDFGPLRERARALGLRRIVMEKLPVIAIVIPFAWIAAAGQASDASMASAEEHGLVTRSIQAGYGASFYAARTLWPGAMLPLHRVPLVEQFFAAWMLVPALAALAASVLAIALWKRLGPFAWAWWAFLVILAPVSGLAQAGAQLVAERYSYLSCAPFALLAGAACVLLARRSTLVAWSALALVAGLLAWRANGQTRVWHDSWSLWGHTLAVDPDNDTALINLAVMELETAQTLRDPAQAKAMLRAASGHAARASELHPEPRRFINLAATHVKLADYEPEKGPDHIGRAVAAAEHAFALAKELHVAVEPRWGLIRALALYYAERLPEALVAAQETLRGATRGRALTLPEQLDLRRLTADVLGRLGRAKEAVTLLEETARLVPDDPLVWLELSRAHERAGDAARARDAAREGRARADRKLGPNAQREPWYGELVQRSR